MAPVIALETVSKRFGATRAVRDLSLALNEGDFVALLGASGCGKSTTLRLMAGLDVPSAGRVLLHGQDVTGRDAAARNVALMFQAYALYPHLTVAQNIAVPLRMRRLSALSRLPGARLISAAAATALDGIAVDVGRVAETLRLSTLLDRRPGQLSGGQQQRVALARALVRDPSVFLLDEPLSNLDTQLRADTREEIRVLHARTGHPFLLVTHDQADALSMADRVAVMVDGAILQEAPPSEIYRRPATRAVAEFIGQHKMCLFEPGSSAQSLHPLGARSTVGVRPEHLLLDPRGPLSARLVSAAFHGEETVLRLSGPDGQPLTAVLRGTQPLPLPGETLRLRAAPGAVHLFDADGRRMEAAA